MRPDIERSVQAALRPLRVSWSLMLAASIVWAVMGMIASPVVSPSEITTLTPLTLTLAVLGVLSALGTILVDRLVITPERMAAVITLPDAALVQRHLLAGQLVLWSFAVLPALFGFAQLLLDGSLGIHLALCAASLAVLALLLPTRARVTTRIAAVLAGH